MPLEYFAHSCDANKALQKLAKEKNPNQSRDKGYCIFQYHFHKILQKAKKKRETKENNQQM